MRLIASPNKGGSRGNVIWVIIHTAEGALTVDALGNYFAKTSAQASSHVGIDDHEIAQYVPYDQTAWTARSANPYADQAELCAFAAWTRPQWLAHPGMLENCAQWIADRCRARGIPPVKIGPADVAARKPGVIGHIDVTLGLKDGTHTDPGKTFPWDVVMARVSNILAGKPGAIEEDEMSAKAEQQINQIWEWIRDKDNAGDMNMLQAILFEQRGLIAMVRGNDPDPNRNNFHWVADVVTTAVGNATEQMVKAIDSGAQIDPAQVRAAIEAATAESIAKAVADEEDRRARDNDPATGPVS